MTPKFIAIIQTGQAIPTALEKFGDFDDWFIQAMATEEIQTRTFRVFEKLEFPEMNQLAGIIITGSSSMVTDEEHWSEKTIDWLKQSINHNIPTLGVCYGHQLLAKALGGEVDWNPRGRQIGQINVDLTSQAHADPLFEPVISLTSNTIKLIATHQQSVVRVPESLTILAATNQDDHHSFRYQNHIWGTQFHPEFTTDIIREYIQARAQDLLQEGLNPQDISSLMITNDNGKKILKRFKDLCFIGNRGFV